MIEITVDYHSSGQRVDRLLRKQYDQLPLSKIFALFRKKKVRLNGTRSKGSEILNEGDVISIYEKLDGLTSPKIEIPTEEESGWTSASPKVSGFEKPKLDVIFEDDHFLIINKKAGTPVQPGSGVKEGSSLIEQVWAYIGIAHKAQLAHRLDKGTSGVIAIGKDGPSIRELTECIRSRKAVKKYQCLVVGKVKDQGTIKLNLERQDAAVGSKMNVSDEGIDSVTHFKMLQQNENYSLVEVVLETGRMHQIRAHMNHIGHPLIGDDRYGDFEKNKKAKKEFKIKRLCLHACELELPNVGLFKSDVPEMFLRVF